MHDLLDGLDVLLESMVIPTSTCAPSYTTAATSDPVLCSLASAVRSPTGTPTRRPRSTRARSRCSSSRCGCRRCRRHASSRCARALGPLASRFHGDPSRRCVCSASPVRTARRRRPTCSRRSREAHGDRVGAHRDARHGDRRCAALPPVHTTPEATELQASFATHARRGRRHRRDGGVVARARPAPRRRHAVRRGVLHEPLARPPRLPRLDGRRTSQPRRACSRISFPSMPRSAIDDPYGQVLRDRAVAAGLDVWTYAAADAGAAADITAEDVECTAEHTRFTLVSRRDARRAAVVSTTLLGRLQRREHARRRRDRARRRASLRRCRRTDSARRFIVPGRFERVDAGRDFAVLVDYAHTPDALEHVLARRPRADAVRAAALSVVYGCGGDRDRAKRPLMGAPRPRLADRAYLTSDNPRSEDPAAIAADILAGVDRRSSTGRSSSTAASRSGARSPTRRAATSSSSRARATSRARPSAGRPCRSTTASVAREELRDGAMRLTAAEIAHTCRRRGRHGRSDTLVTSWAFDSRALDPGACFVALKDHRDGHDFVGAAFRAGAHVALVDRARPGDRRRTGAATLVRFPT